jgi:hypothetical protein
VTYTQTVENPLDVALAIKRNAVLGMVVDDVGALSSNAIDLSGSLIQRTRTQGTAEAQTAAVSAADRIVAIDYLEEYFWNYTNASTDRPLAYEMEYVLCGKETDQANLEGVIDRLLLLRESSNVIHIMGDAEKVALANSIATALAGFTLNPAIIKAVEVGIIGAWAYLESVQDVRALLQGDKIALLKTKDQWTVDLAHLSASFQATAKAKSCENGLTYQQYLKGFLYLEGDASLAYRMMDLMEKRIQMAEGTTNFRADHMLTQMTYVCTYRGTPLFSELAIIGHLSVKQYLFSSKKKLEYHTT